MDGGRTVDRARTADPGPLLEGRRALVTGGGHGIGRGTCLAFGSHGAAVVVADVDGEAAERTASDVVAAGGAAWAVTADVTDRGAAAATVEAAVDRLGGLDVLVNGVGHYLHPVTPFADVTDDQIAELYEINLGHVLRVTRAALPHLIAAGGPEVAAGTRPGPSIVNLTTVEAFRGIPGHPVYAAFKAAVVQFSKSLALQVSEHGIRVNDIAPDVTRSQQLPYERWLGEEDVARIPSWVPLGRLGEPGDAAGVAVFLASELSAFVTGTTVHCDGGTYAAGGWYRTRHGRGWTNRPHDA
ncbi:SDR family NAD(P)-dependent oxidoreductase [Dermatobacter hominis]|uniref:SDR family NAD(P)-dependent oxidoreductase n=1 Tax=Dermatobacter hominis TaxID=2884263 RepID=UPI001D122216|nr:SDR family oxidoreductase [Dermatobacter hominis]UDY35706.1 SDR family oxidoreductase [Dermatobacter hominis]